MRNGRPSRCVRCARTRPVCRRTCCCTRARRRSSVRARPCCIADEDISRHGRSAGDLEEESVVRSLDPVVHDHAIAIAHVVPDAIGVGLIEDEIVAEDDATRLVEDLDRRRVIARELLDVVPPDDVSLQQYIRRPDHVNAFRAGVADERVADDESVAAKVSGHARAVTDRHVLDQRASRFLAERGRIRQPDGLIRRFIVGGEVLLAFHLERAIGVLRERNPANDRTFVVVWSCRGRRLLVRTSALSNAVISTNLFVGSTPIYTLPVL